jgi:MFS transporter, Spinster family, sphingosine-1-phosphate transporter
MRYDGEVTDAAGGPSPRVAASDSRKAVTLGVLTVIYAFIFSDRAAFGILLHDIQVTLKLSDVQVGFLTGIATSFFYALLGIPVAQWADRGNRPLIIALSSLFWGVAVSICGFTGNLVQLFIARIAASAGEAGIFPPASSLMADYYSRVERPRASTIFMLGSPIGGMVGTLLAGWLNVFLGWRTTLFLFGLPGALLAAMAWFGLVEPRTLMSRSGIGQRDGARMTASEGLEPADYGGLLSEGRSLWHNLTFRWLTIGLSILTLIGGGMGAWTSIYFIREFGVSTGTLGSVAIPYGLCGLAGIYIGGMLISRVTNTDERRQLQLSAVLFLLQGVLSCATYLANSWPLALSFYLIGALIGSAFLGPVFGLAQSVVPARQRALSVALILLTTNLTAGFGPVLVGSLSEALGRTGDAESLRWGLLLLAPVSAALAALSFFRASITASRDIDEAQAIK